MAYDWKKHPIWKQWGELTAYHNALDVACDWYSALWSLVPIEEIDKTQVVRRRDVSEFTRNTGEFRKLLDDRLPLANLIFLSSYALFETYCTDAFERLSAASKAPVSADYLTGGIECWTDRLLKLSGRNWSAVKCGRAGILEVGLVRNSLAHGAKAFSVKDVARFTAIGLTPPWNPNHPIPSTPLAMLELRHRLNYYLTILQQGLIKTLK